MKEQPVNSEVLTSTIRWLVRIVGVLLLVAIAAFGLFDTWASHIAYLIHGGGGPEPIGPGGLTLVEWTVMFVGLLLALFWEGPGGVIIVLAAVGMQVDVIVNLGGQLNPIILLFVFVGLAFIFCWWFAWWLTHPQSLPKDALKLSPPGHVHGLRSQRWRLVTQLLVVLLLVAALVWRVVVYLQPPLP